MALGLLSGSTGPSAWILVSRVGTPADSRHLDDLQPLDRGQRFLAQERQMFAWIDVQVWV